MKKLVTSIALSLFLATAPAYAHHPAEDIVDAEIYDMIDEMVSDTPHADMEFDDEMGTTTITADSVSAAEELIDDGLLATLSLLDEASVTVTFVNDVDLESSTMESDENNQDRWQERNDWGGQVIFTVDTLLCEEPLCE